MTEKIEWKLGEPTNKLYAAPVDAPCTVVREWTDIEGRPMRETVEGYVSRKDGDTYFACYAFWSLDRPPSGVRSVTVTLPAPEWAKDRWVMRQTKLGAVAYHNRGRDLWEAIIGMMSPTRLDELLSDDAVIIRLTKEQQDALDAGLD